MKMSLNANPNYVLCDKKQKINILAQVSDVRDEITLEIIQVDLSFSNKNKTIPQRKSFKFIHEFYLCFHTLRESKTVYVHLGPLTQESKITKDNKQWLASQSETANGFAKSTLYQSLHLKT